MLTGLLGSTILALSVASGTPTVIIHGLHEANREHVEIGPQQKVPQLDLELGDQISDLIVELKGKGEYRVVRSVTASVTVTDEGPHIDLIGTADKTHAAVQAERLGKIGQRYRLPKISAAERKAGKYTKAQLKEALKQRKVGEHWLQVVDGEYGPSEAPSSVKVEIQARAGKKWKTVRTFVINVPMGC